jgi:lipopolysaccharide/colanic/teichoic acid biosynthesis glycosyltransferase
MTVDTFQKSPLYHQAVWLRHIEPEKHLLKGKRYLAVKRGMDLSLILLSLPLLTFIFLLCALLIKLESPDGPILFVQKRTGKDGRRFDMYKFRTMVPNAEALKKELAHLNELQWPDFKITNDPRITRVGRFLRKTSLDELPQFINILLGDMSLVGPRPTSFALETYLLWQTVRLEARPGITGLWQLYGRAEVEFIDRVRIDEIYVERCCLWLDIQILIRTIPAVLKQRGAH